MQLETVIFTIYLFLAIYCCGSMTVLQLQHFALYKNVGAENFKAYITANNKAALVPAILPALLLLLSTLFLLFLRPPFMDIHIAIISFACNLVNIISTAIWQGRIHGELARTGFQENLVSQLINTNWIRTAALFIQAITVVYCVSNNLPK